jgi:hypothetical protein
MTSARLSDGVVLIAWVNSPMSEPRGLVTGPLERLTGFV